MRAKCWWTTEQVRQLQKRLEVPQTEILNKPTWDALTKALGMGDSVMPPNPEPTPKANPYFVRNHWLYKNNDPVSRKDSPNHGGIINPELIVIHYTGTPGISSPLQWLTQSGSGVSSHLVISTDGVVWQLLPFNLRAWHAGVSSWAGQGDVNSWSIGIENVGIGQSWPEAQIIANIQVVECLAKHYGIDEVVGHSDVAPGRKVDPGPIYPWKRVWPDYLEY